MSIGSLSDILSCPLAKEVEVRNFALDDVYLTGSSFVDSPARVHSDMACRHQRLLDRLLFHLRMGETPRLLEPGPVS